MQEAVCMKDPKTNKLIIDPEELKKASLKYVTDLLKNRDPKPGYEYIIEEMENLHELRMSENEENIDTDEELTQDDFQKLTKHLQKKNNCYFVCIKRSKNGDCFLLC